MEQLIAVQRWRHGTESGYSSRGCRCGECREAHRRTVAGTRARARARGLAPRDPRHGTAAGYDHWHCRCRRCIAAGHRKHVHDHAVYMARRKAANSGASG